MLGLPRNFQKIVRGSVAKWVFKTKFLSDGILKKFKAHLVAQGSRQVEGLNYKNLPVIRYEPVCILADFQRNTDVKSPGRRCIPKKRTD